MSSSSDRQDSELEDAMLAMLVGFQRRKQQRARRSEPDTAYERILGHFERRGQRLRGERLVTAELIDRLFAGAKTLPHQYVHQELQLAARPGEVAAGRIRITNRSAATARFDLVVGTALDRVYRGNIRFEAERNELSPGETRLVRVEASSTGLSAGDSITLPIECRWAHGVDRLWLVLSVDRAKEFDR